MSPNTTMSDTAYVLISDLESASHSKKAFAVSAPLPYLSDFFCRQFGRPLPLTSRRTALRRHICLVLRTSSQPEVSGIATAPVVAAGAIVQNTEVSRNAAVSQEQCKTVRFPVLLVVLGTTIAIFFVDWASPQPAVAGTIQFGPELFGRHTPRQATAPTAAILTPTAPNLTDGGMKQLATTWGRANNGMFRKTISSHGILPKRVPRSGRRVFAALVRLFLFY